MLSNTFRGILKVLYSCLALGIFVSIGWSGTYGYPVPTVPHGGGIVSVIGYGSPNVDRPFTYQPSSGAVTCVNGGPNTQVYGTIQFDYVWSGSDAPPKCVVIKKSGSVQRGSDQTPTNTVSDGLGHPNIVQSTAPYSGASTSSGDLYEVKQNPGSSFSVTITPQGRCDYGYIFATFSVDVTPVVVSITGSAVVGNSVLALVGQKQSAQLSAGGYQLSNVTWSNPLIGFYKGESWQSNYTTPSGTYDAHHYLQLTCSDLASNPFSYYILEPLSVGVYASATISLPDGSTRSITGEAGEDVVGPDYEMHVISTGTTQLSYSGTQVGIYAGDYTSLSKVGAAFSYRVAAKSPFNNSASSVCYLSQLVQTLRTGTTASGDTITIKSKPNYVEDTQLVYDKPVAPYIADNTIHATGYQTDTPGQNMITSGSNRDISVSISDNFKMFLIYLPPGNAAGSSIRVPLHVNDWQWHTSAAEGAYVGVWNLTGGNPTSSGSGEYPTDDFQWDDYVSSEH